MISTLTYLAGPYSHSDQKIMDYRYSAITFIACQLLKKGHYVYSPLTHNIPFTKLGIEQNWESWKHFDCFMLSKSDKLLIVMLPGWETSTGVSDEIQYAISKDIVVEYLQPDELLKDFTHNTCSISI